MNETKVELMPSVSEPVTMPQKKKTFTWAWASKRLRRLLGYLTMIFMIVAIVFPVYWLIVSSFKPEIEVVAYPPTFLPQTFSLEGYHNLLQNTQFILWFKNTAIVSVAATALAVVLSATGAYVLTRRTRSRPVQNFALVILFAYMIPDILLIVPIFQIVTRLKLSDSLLGLIVVYCAILLPFGLWTLRAYFAGIPHEIEEAAMIDGANRFQAFYIIVLPQALPGVIATALFAFNVTWGEFLYAFILLPSGSQMTLNPGIQTLMGATSDQGWVTTMAAATLATLPVILLFGILQRFLVAGWGGGAVKG